MKFKKPSELIKSFFNLFQDSLNKCKQISLPYRKCETNIFSSAKSSPSSKRRTVLSCKRPKLSLSLPSTHSYMSCRWLKSDTKQSKHKTMADTKVEIGFSCYSLDTQLMEPEDPDGSTKIEFDPTSNPIY